MLKKVITIILSLCLMLSISVMAENTVNNENIPAEASERPMRGDFDPSRMPRGNFDPSQMPEGNFTPPQRRNDTEIQSALQNADDVSGQNQEKGTHTNELPNQNMEKHPQTDEGQSQFGGEFPGGRGGFPGNMQNDAQNTQTVQETGVSGFVKTYSTPITSVVLLGLAYLFVVFYKRKHY